MYTVSGNLIVKGGAVQGVRMTVSRAFRPVQDLTAPSALVVRKVDGDSFDLLSSPWDFLLLEKVSIEGAVVPGLFETPINAQSLLNDPVGGPGTYDVERLIGGFEVPILTPGGEPVRFAIP